MQIRKIINIISKKLPHAWYLIFYLFLFGLFLFCPEKLFNLRNIDTYITLVKVHFWYVCQILST